MLLPGQTFFFPSHVDTHRWVVISDPQAHPAHPVVIVSFTTFKDKKDPTCVVTPRGFSSLDRDSCIYYVGAKGVPLPGMRSLIASGHVSVSSQVPAHVLDRIRSGFGKSREPPIYLKNILREQGLIP